MAGEVFEELFGVARGAAVEVAAGDFDVRAFFAVVEAIDGLELYAVLQAGGFDVALEFVPHLASAIAPASFLHADADGAGDTGVFACDLDAEHHATIAAGFGFGRLVAGDADPLSGVQLAVQLAAEGFGDLEKDFLAIDAEDDAAFAENISEETGELAFEGKGEAGAGVIEKHSQEKGAVAQSARFRNC